MTTLAPPKSLEWTVDRLCRVPVAARRFTVSPELAWSDYRIDAGLVDRLTAAGLPCVHDGDCPLFDSLDLINVSLNLQLPSLQRVAMRNWVSVLTRPAGERRTYQLDYLAACPAPGHGGVCEFLCCTPDDGEVTVRRDGGDSGTPLLSLRVPVQADWPELPDPVKELVREIADIDMLRLPDRIKWDTGFMLREKIGDCLGIARHLTEQGLRRRLPMRMVFGLIVASPYATPHFWAETRIESRWVPVDPGLVRGLIAWGLLAPGWPDDRSPGPFLVPLTGRHGFAVSHRGIAAPVSFRAGAV